METKYYATGKRKTSISRVFLILNGTGKIIVNNKSIEKYFPSYYLDTVYLPLKVTDLLGKVDIYCTVKGGGIKGQAEAIRHGIARAINSVDFEKFHKALKQLKLLTRDPRVVERKKYGLKKARKAPQYSKR